VLQQYGGWKYVSYVGQFEGDQAQLRKAGTKILKDAPFVRREVEVTWMV